MRWFIFSLLKIVIRSFKLLSGRVGAACAVGRAKWKRALASSFAKVQEQMSKTNDHLDEKKTSGQNHYHQLTIAQFHDR